MMSEPRELQALLAWSGVPSLGERTLQALLDHAREGRRTLADLWDAPLEDVAAIVRLHPKARAALEVEAEARWRAAGEDVAVLRAAGVDVLVSGDPETPACLSSVARRRPLVFAYGALAMLEEPRVALVSSQGVSREGLAVTDALADALARRDVPLVASANREAYQAAATAAKRQGSPSVMVLDRTLSGAIRDGGPVREPVAPARVWDEAFDPELQLLLSPFGWRERWSRGAGRRRDALIFDLADLVVAVDVRPGGIMDGECRSAACSGKPVLALDRGPDTAEGTRKLWEDCSQVLRVSWSGSEAAVREVLRSLPGVGGEASADRPAQGRQREIAQFLLRACELHRRRGASPPVIGAYPASGVMAQVARAWSARDDEAAGVTVLLADLVSGGAHSEARPAQLLERVAPGGVLAAVVPSAWIQAEQFARAREEWLSRGSLRLAAALPLPVQAAGCDQSPSAAILLQRGGSEAPPQVFSPQTERMGRFHLRRYFQEVLAAVAGTLRRGLD